MTSTVPSPIEDVLDVSGVIDPAHPETPTVGGRRRRRGLARLVGTPVGVVGILLLLGVLALAVFGPVIWGARADAYDLDALSSGPTAAHPFGTDMLGRDLLFRVLVASRLSIQLAVSATVVGVVLGVILGLLPIVLPGRFGRALVASIGVAVAFPGLLLALFFATIFGVGATGAVLALGLAGAPSFARLTHTLASGIAGRDFISAARVLGVGRLRVLVRHVLPNIAEPLVVNATLAAGSALLSFAGLSFLGLGVQQPDFDWGRLLNEGLAGIYLNPMAAIGPGIAIVVAGLAFSLSGEFLAAAVGRRSSRSKGVARAAELWSGAGRARVGRSDDSPGNGAIDVGADVLDIRALRVGFPTTSGIVTPVRGVDLRIAAGESVGIVGESGSGKSLTALAAAQLIELPGLVSAERMVLDGADLGALSGREGRSRLAATMAMVFQDPMTSLNPVMRVGKQLAEVVTEHRGASRRAAWDRAVQRLSAVRIPEPERRARQYPHEFSGGMRQRAVIGIGLMGEPKLLIADEPTTALDVTVQRRVLELIQQVRADNASALLLISHDIAVISGMCDRVLVMYAGRVVEEISTVELLTDPAHPYTRALLAAVPEMDTDLDVPLATIPGRPPAPAEIGTGCAFAPRCAFATDACRTEDPQLRSIGPAHRVACLHPQGTSSGIRTGAQR
ncbi:dipeptide/oligopeptide/nickel ABC transporter permease/ATP-binding protein [Nakamurella sp. A5-74]|uniref:Dipeptide/oligopeptide/nickel ABC transporter permease/ATP-binding protein n=1 Tax=Nakamurella sp. A5-74 TaxID=3158264 RepID=A0AAU8DPP3_9ACTN